MSHRIRIFIIAVLVIGLGFLRDSFFVHLNAQAGVSEGRFEQFRQPFLWKFMEGLSGNTIVYLKWSFTLIFFMLYLAVMLLIVKWFFNSRKNVMITLSCYGFVLLLSAASIMLGYILSDTTGSAYTFARWLMGAGQSPILIMLLTLLFFASRQSEKQAIQKQGSPFADNPYKKT